MGDGYREGVIAITQLKWRLPSGSSVNSEQHDLMKSVSLVLMVIALSSPIVTSLMELTVRLFQDLLYGDDCCMCRKCS